MNLQIQLEKSGQVLKCIITWGVKAHYIVQKMMSQNFLFFLVRLWDLVMQLNKND